MANYKEDIVDIELENGTVHRSFLNHTLGSGDEKANRFGVRTFRNGEPESVSNGCYGYFIRADGTTVGPIEGVITGADSNKAYVTLPAACYAIEGNFQLAIKVTTTTTSGTLRIIDGVVSKTTTDTIVDPGTVVDSVDELVQAIEDAIAAIPEDYTPTLAPAFAADTANDPASYVVYDGKFYLLPDGHTAGTAWSSTTKTETKVGPEITQLRKVAFKSAEASVASNDLNNCKVGYVMLSSGTTYTHAPYNTGKVAHVLTYGSYLTGTDANRYLIQYYFTDGSTTGEVWRRTRSSGTWGDWAKIYDGVGIFRSAQTAVASNDLDNCEVGYVFLDYSSTYTHAPYDDNRVAHVVTYGSYRTGNDSNRYIVQYYFTDADGKCEVWRRRRSAGTWLGWEKIFDKNTATTNIDDTITDMTSFTRGEQTSQGANTGTKLKVMSYNICNYNHDTVSTFISDSQLVELRKMLGKQNADFVMLQEEAQYINGSNQSSDAYVFLPMYPYRYATTGSVVRSKMQGSAGGSVKYTNYDRYITYGLYNISETIQLLCVSTHPVWGGTGETYIAQRDEQYHELCQWVNRQIELVPYGGGSAIKAPVHTHVIIGIDTNAGTETDFTNLLSRLSAADLIPGNCGRFGRIYTCNVNSESRRSCIDNIIVSNNVIINSFESLSSLDRSLWSDHVPVVADVTLT